jgi:hypothetical protein
MCLLEQMLCMVMSQKVASLEGPEKDTVAEESQIRDCVYGHSFESENNGSMATST